MPRRTKTVWQCRDRRLELGARTALMGVLNVTPDSFSDGGRYLEPARAVEHGLAMAGDGADILDVGGESTRPGAAPISVGEELRRVLPVIRKLAGQTPALLSIDTAKAAVAEAALDAGAHIVNDVSALTADPRMAEVVRACNAGVVLMHCQGTPRTMQDAPRYNDVVAEIRDYLAARVRRLAADGLNPETLALDPGIGFGKTVEHNVRCLAHADALGALGRPVVLGLSRKSFLGKLTGRDVGERLGASLGAMAYALTRGAHVLRVHDVRESRDVAACLDAFLAEES